MKKLDVYEIQYNDQKKQYSVLFQKDGKMYTYGENKLLIVTQTYDRFSISRKTSVKRIRDDYQVGKKELNSYGVKVFSIEDNDEDIKILLESPKNPIYSFCQQCYRCQRNTKVYTYLLYESDLTSMIYPWDKIRLNDEKTPEEYFSHLRDGEMEYYPIVILGDRELLKRDYLGKLEEWDKLMEQWVPEIKLGKSKRAREIFKQEEYLANHCQICHCLQGNHFIREKIDRMIQHMVPLEVDCYIEDLMLLDLLNQKGIIKK